MNNNKFDGCRKAWEGAKFEKNEFIVKWTNKRSVDFLNSCLEADFELDGRKARGHVDHRIDRQKLTKEAESKRKDGVTYRSQAHCLGVTEKQWQRAIRNEGNLYKSFSDKLIKYYGKSILY
jgi:hypothetical protein